VKTTREVDTRGGSGWSRRGRKQDHFVGRDIHGAKAVTPPADAGTLSNDAGTVSNDAASLAPASISQAAADFRRMLASFEPDELSPASCADVAEALAKTEMACAAARTRAAARAAQAGEHRRRGFADAQDWLSSRTGSTMGKARAEMETARQAEKHPAIAEALRQGEVSLAQAEEVVRVEGEVPGSAEVLLDLARRSGLGQLREVARRVTLGSLAPEDLERRQHRARHFRHWRDALGMVCFSGALPPDVGVGIANRIDTEAARLRREAGAEGKSEPFEAHAADALVKLLQGQGEGRGRAEVVVVVDLSAYRRGHAHPGELSHIVGGGPVPVRFVKQAMKDAFVKAVVHDGVKVLRVKHFGRHMKAEVRTALELGQPPGFEGAKCSFPGCDRRYGLEWDHVRPLSRHGPTNYDNLQPLCKPHHWEKTQQDKGVP
jgi:hypothetical protein